jgi:RNA polymerase sigma-32 factor
MAKELTINQDEIFIGPLGSLGAYINIVNQVPVLSKEEEKRLALSYQNDNDLDAARRLIMSQLRFVVYIARGYSGYGLSLADLIQEGNIGLMKAVKRFDPDRGFRLVTYAVHWIRAEIHEFIFNNWKLVKVATTKAQRKLFFNLRKNKKHLGWLSKQETESIAKDLGVKPKEVTLMEQKFASKDLAFDLRDNNNEDEYVAPAGYLPSLNADPAETLQESDWLTKNTEALTLAMKDLDERSKNILKSRWLEEKKLTLKDLSKKYNISIERVRQIEENAIKILRETLIEA